MAGRKDGFTREDIMQLRRLATQIVAQLPADQREAEKVLELSCDLIRWINDPGAAVPQLGESGRVVRLGRGSGGSAVNPAMPADAESR